MARKLTFPYIASTKITAQDYAKLLKLSKKRKLSRSEILREVIGEYLREASEKASLAKAKSLAIG